MTHGVFIPINRVAPRIPIFAFRSEARVGWATKNRPACDETVLEARHAVMLNAFATNPKRFSAGKPKRPPLPSESWINQLSPERRPLNDHTNKDFSYLFEGRDRTDWSITSLRVADRMLIY
jgi:hypothetical protein